MTPRQFASALAATRMPAEGRTATACRLVLVDGLSDRQAAQRVGIEPSAVTRARNKLAPRVACPHCNGTGFAG